MSNKHAKNTRLEELKYVMTKYIIFRYHDIRQWIRQSIRYFTPRLAWIMGCPTW